MEISESHRILREVYAISNNLELPFTEVKVLNKGEREYMYNIVRNSLENKRNPKNVMAANYHTTKAKLFITENGAGSDILVKEYTIKNVMNDIEVEAIFDTLTFEPNKHDTHAFGFILDGSEVIYIKYDDKMDKISFKDMVYLNIFDRMYEVQRAEVINAFELGGKYNMLKITKYNGTQST